MKRVISCLVVFSILIFCISPVEASFDLIELLKEKVRYTQHFNEGCSDTTFQLTQEDAERLMKIAQAEAGTEGSKGQLKVMCVVMNRVKNSSYPNDIQSVISQEGQFETYWNGTYAITEPTVDSHLALAMLEMNKDIDTEIIAFEANWNDQSLLKYFDLAYVYKGHTFYTLKKD